MTLNNKPTSTARAARNALEPSSNEHRFGSADQFADIPEPRKAALEQLSTRIAKEQDDHIVEALQRYLLRAIAGPAELAALATRMRCVSDARNPQAGDVWFLDNVEVLWVGPVHVEQEGNKLRASREYRHLLPELPA